MESEKSNEDRLMISSIAKYVSDWVGRSERQPPPFRPLQDLEDPPPDDAAIELRVLGDASTMNTVNEEKKRVYTVALKEWKSINNLDAFLEQVYYYYQNGGYLGLVLSRVSNLALVFFLSNFLLFLLYCVDWDFVHHSATATTHPTLAGVVKLSGIWQMSWIVSLFVIAFYAVYIWQVVQVFRSIKDNTRIRRFYNFLLNISDNKLVATEFSLIVRKIEELNKRHCLEGIGRLDACDIANRIMRRENYLIALFNKEVFDIEMPLMSSGKSGVKIAKTLEWNLSFGIINYFFDENGLVRRTLLKESTEDKAIQSLQRRFVMLGLLNIIFAPAILIFIIMYFIFRHGEEFYRNPKNIAQRQYTTTARWKFREFNELPHYFEQRLSRSYRKAAKFMEQSQGNRWTPLAKFISFVTGSMAIVLIALTIVNEDLLMHFEITSGKSIIWYLGFLGLILAISRSMVPDWSKVADPSKLMTEISYYTHYMPKHWRGHLDSEMVKEEFGTLFDYKIKIFFHELIGVVTTPFILIFSMPSCAGKLIEFFKEFTIHVDGLGYVCSFAIFDFKRHGNVHYGVNQEGSSTAKDNCADLKYFLTKQGKMEKSFISFVEHNPTWKPDNMGEQYLKSLTEFQTSDKRDKDDDEGKGMDKEGEWTSSLMRLIKNPIQRPLKTVHEDNTEEYEYEEDEAASLPNLYHTLDNLYESRNFTHHF